MTFLATVLWIHIIFSSIYKSVLRDDHLHNSCHLQQLIAFIKIITIYVSQWLGMSTYITAAGRRTYDCLIGSTFHCVLLLVWFGNSHCELCPVVDELPCLALLLNKFFSYCAAKMQNGRFFKPLWLKRGSCGVNLVSLHCSCGKARQTVEVIWGQCMWSAIYCLIVVMYYVCTRLQALLNIVHFYDCYLPC